MPLKTETRIIEGDPPLELTVTQLPALDAFELFADVGEVLGPLFLELPSISLEDGDQDAQMLSPVMQRFFTRLANGKGRKLIKDALSRSTVKVDGKQAAALNTQEQINAIFGGRMHDMLLATRIALEVNFGNFTDIISAVSGIPKDAVLNSMKQLKESGQSGDSGLKES